MRQDTGKNEADQNNPQFVSKKGRAHVKSLEIEKGAGQIPQNQRHG